MSHIINACILYPFILSYSNYIYKWKKRSCHCAYFVLYFKWIMNALCYSLEMLAYHSPSIHVTNENKWSLMFCTHFIALIQQPPRIQPMNLLVEGRTMTVVCVALGDPTPTISLYINGKLIKQQKNRHLTQVVENITREMDIVSCYADNGYGTPMQSARRIQVSRKSIWKSCIGSLTGLAFCCNCVNFT